MTEYTPEKVAELVERLRRVGAESTQGTHTGNSPILRGADLANRTADALTAVSAERDAVIVERDDLEDRLAAYLCDSTGGRLSKTGYDVRTMVQHTEEYYDRVHGEELDRIEATHDRLHKAITEALEYIDHTIHVIDDEDGEPCMDDEADAYTEGASTAQHAIARILRAALDKEGNDDE